MLEEAKKLRTPQMHAALALDLNTGLRDKELREIRWEQIDLPPAIAADRLDVFYAPAYTAPLRLTIPIVVLIHDLSYVAHPEWFRFREGLRRRWPSRSQAYLSSISGIPKSSICSWMSSP